MAHRSLAIIAWTSLAAVATVLPLCVVFYKLYESELGWIRSQAELAQRRDTWLAAEYARSRIELAAARLASSGDLAGQASGPPSIGQEDGKYAIRCSSFWSTAGNSAHLTVAVLARDGRRVAGAVGLEDLLRPATAGATLPRSYLIDNLGRAYPFGGSTGSGGQVAHGGGKLLQAPAEFHGVDLGPTVPVVEGLAVSVASEPGVWEAAEEDLRTRFALGATTGAASGAFLVLLAGWALTRAREQVGRTLGQLERARHDGLTGLAGRDLFLERAEAILRGVRGRNGFGVAVMYIDLDGFKALNDRRGHAHGDQVLKAVATRLLKCIREADALGRIGGDEFVICFAAPMASLPGLAALAARRISSDIGSLEDGLGCSIGWAFNRADSALPDLLEEADRAMYAQKRTRGGRPPTLQCA